MVLYSTCEHCDWSQKTPEEELNQTTHEQTNHATRDRWKPKDIKYEKRTSGGVVHDETGWDGVRASASIGDEPHAKIAPSGIYHDVGPDSGHLFNESPASSLRHVHIVESVVTKSHSGKCEGDLHLAAERESPPAVLARCIGLQPDAIEEQPPLDGPFINVPGPHCGLWTLSCTIHCYKWAHYNKRIWANQPIHSFLVGCLNPCFQGISVQVGSS